MSHARLTAVSFLSSSTHNSLMARRSARLKEKQVAACDGDAQTQDGNIAVSELKTGQPHRDGSCHDDQEESEEEESEGGPSRKRARKVPKKRQPQKESTNEDNQSEPSAKKLKRMPEEFRKVRGKLGMLERLAKDVPLDVIFEVGMQASFDSH